MKALVNSVRAFAREEDGVALSEYLVLLGLLLGGVIAAVTLVSGNLATAWASWGTFFTTNLTAGTPKPVPTPGG
ncbi:hypothetical protein K9B32_20280 [Rhizobium sp. 3T7]|uniref:hypothetical protein n=1 Tax=Rhizobium sp. 3T7 TaxID=2874922 RepID=UPI001CCDD680|nr:hypothetical protein [Rhizobium sp. 3T7]MBZ9792428.1 hypothetical protein [Rhizobium sp. 3T7]